MAPFMASLPCSFMGVSYIPWNSLALISGSRLVTFSRVGLGQGLLLELDLSGEQDKTGKERGS
jgi:hypothetical protein